DVPAELSSLSRHREPRLGLVLRRKVFECGLTDIHHHANDRVREGERRCVQVGNWRAGVAASVEALVGCKKSADRFDACLRRARSRRRSSPTLRSPDYLRESKRRAVCQASIFLLAAAIRFLRSYTHISALIAYSALPKSPVSLNRQSRLV